MLTIINSFIWPRGWATGTLFHPGFLEWLPTLFPETKELFGNHQGLIYYQGVSPPLRNSSEGLFAPSQIPVSNRNTDNTSVSYFSPHSTVIKPFLGVLPPLDIGPLKMWAALILLIIVSGP